MSQTDLKCKLCPFNRRLFRWHMNTKWSIYELKNDGNFLFYASKNLSKNKSLHQMYYKKYEAKKIKNKKKNGTLRQFDVEH